MNNKKRKIIIGVFIGAALGLVGFLYAANYYRVDAGKKAHINEHDVCKVVVNPSGYSDIFVPTKTSGEWEAFRDDSKRPSHVKLWDCVYGLYLTESTYNGNLGGRSGADSKCNDEKPSRCVDNKPAWAFISVSDTDEIRDMPSTKGLYTGRPWIWIKPDGWYSEAANDLADLLDGSIENRAYDAGYKTGDNYYTGSNSDGSLKSTCASWTSSGSHTSVTCGDAFYKNTLWLFGVTGWCNYTHKLLCACDAY